MVDGGTGATQTQGLVFQADLDQPGHVAGLDQVLGLGPGDREYPDLLLEQARPLVVNCMETLSSKH